MRTVNINVNNPILSKRFNNIRLQNETCENRIKREVLRQQDVLVACYCFFNPVKMNFSASISESGHYERLKAADISH